MKKRVLAMVLVLVLAVGVVPMSASAAFSKRSTDPGLNNTTYNSGNPYSKKQCTWYAWGRYKELCGVNLPNWGAAGNWLTKAQAAGYSTGPTPKEGAIACWTADVWDNTSHITGHVAVVEAIEGNTIRISQYNRGVKYGGGEKFGGMDGNTWKANFLEAVSTTRTSWSGNNPPKPSGYIYLKETEKKVTVTFDANGGTPTTEKNYTMGVGVKFGSITTPTRTGYTFEHWTYCSSAPGDYVPESTTVSNYLDEDTQIAAFFDGSEGHVTVYALWYPCAYTVSFNANGGRVSTSSQRVYYNWPYNFKGALPIPTYSGYNFDGWYTAASGGTKINNDTKVTTAGNQTLYAHWTEIPVISTPSEPDCDKGHTWGSWATVTEATCEKAGSQERECSVCGTTDTQRIDALGHDYQVGRETDTYIRYTCSNCNDSYTVEKEANCDNGHTWGDWDGYDPTCGSDGWRYRFCEVCGKEDEEDLPATGKHHYVYDDETAYSIYYVCRDCGDFKWEDKEEPELIVQVSKLPFPCVNSCYEWTFADVGRGDWFFLNVSSAYEMGLMKGTGANAFSPYNNVTIAEAITLAARIHKIYCTGSDSFPSYDGGNWYDPYVDYARDNGIVNTYYDYARPATREQFVRILSKALPASELTNIGGTAFFADSNNITYAAEVALLSGAGVINGIQENGLTYFKPLNPITRAEVAAIIGRMAMPDTRTSAAVLTPSEILLTGL